MKRISAFITLACAAVMACMPVFLSGETFNITQIDNSMLLINQEVRAYLSLLDTNGYPNNDLKQEHLKVFEEGKEVKIKKFAKGANVNEGITLLFLLDNSGSMYDDAAGVATSNESEMRITFVKQAVQSLLDQIKNPRDRVGLVSFNVRLGTEIRPTSQKIEIEKAIPSITRPQSDEAYTELYESLLASTDFFEATSGRKVTILLSDGQNFPLANNPSFPTRGGIEDAIASNQREGVSVFTIGLSKSADNASLERIARDTGGAFFFADKPGELANLYKLIRDRILGEYMLTYDATMSPTEKRNVRVSYALPGVTSGDAERSYFSETIFGRPQKEFNLFILLAIPLALILLFLLSLINFKKKDTAPSLNLLSTVTRKGTTQALTIAETQKEITIGGSKESDFTIQGDRKVQAAGATIKKKDGEYTLVSDDPVTVNKKMVKTKVLRSGDVITIGTTTIVFDEGVTKTALRDKKK